MPGKAKDYPTTIKRLSIILARLYSGEALSVKELAQEFGVSERTIQRYFNNYLKGTLPLKKVGRRWILESPTSPLIDEESEIALQTIEEMAQEIGIDFYQKIQPLLSKLHRCTFNPFFTKLDIEDISDKFEEIALLEEAIQKRIVIEGSYKRADNQFISITIAPLKIVNFEGYWYLIALDNKSKILKKYYLKNLHHIRPTSLSFTAPKEIESYLKNAINIWFNPHITPFEVRLFVDSTAALYLKRRPISPTQKIVGQDPDGSIEVSITITHHRELTPYIKKWIPHIIVLEPQWLKEQIQKDIQQYLSFYS